ncbi:MAG: hypothetical protein GDA48_04130 [Hormoscilla sp. GM102CHS1]|nr:hypothetical protein [Hormoscilla sp. SP12CHS1]MBC6472095.1 hypothetical protein [Hormoscilla sp. GM102CHS1]
MAALHILGMIVVSCQLSVVSCQLLVVSCHLSLLTIANADNNLRLRGYHPVVVQRRIGFPASAKAIHCSKIPQLSHLNS